MATPRRRISDYRAGDAGNDDAGRKPGLLRLGGDPRNVGVSAAYYSDHCNNQGPAGSPAQQNEVEILSDLIAGPAGELARTISAQLLGTYGSLINILATAKIGELRTTDVSNDVLQRLEYLAGALGSAWRREALGAPIFDRSQALIKYLKFEMAALKRETFRVLFLDSGNALLYDQIMWEGSVNRVQIHPREVVSRALEVHASALILVHNHPSGRSEPSTQDVHLTEQIVGACKLLEIAVHDHLIVTRNDVFSMRREQRVTFSP